MVVKLTAEEKEQLKEATKKIDEGSATYRELADEFHVGLGTVYTYHAKRCEEDVSRLKKELDEVSHTYRDTVKKLYAERKKLKEDIATLKQRKAEVTHIFKDRKLTWEHGLSLLRDVSDLRFEKIKIKKELGGYKQLIENKKGELGETERTVKRLRAVERKLQQQVKKLSEQRSAYLGWLQLEAPILEQRRQALKDEVNTLEEMRKDLENKFRSFLEEPHF